MDKLISLRGDASRLIEEVMTRRFGPRRYGECICGVGIVHSDTDGMAWLVQVDRVGDGTRKELGKALIAAGWSPVMVTDKFAYSVQGAYP